MQFGCTQQVSDGTIPNQFGTWIYGRGGWCPGMDVKPFVADVTAQVTPGQDATIAYEGRFEGDPDADLPGGNIWMSSYLVTYE